MIELKCNFIISIYNNFVKIIKLSFLYAQLCKISYDDKFKVIFKDIIRKIVLANSSRTLEGRI